MDMRLGISSYTYGWAVGGPTLQLPTVINELNLVRYAATFGLNTLQIGDNLPLHEFGPSRLAAFANESKQNNLTLEVGAAGLTEEHLETYINMCIALDAPLLRFVVDKGTHKAPVDDITSLIKNALPTLKKNNIKIGIENHDRLRARQLAAIMENVGDEFCGICLDCVNSLGAGEGLEHVVEVLAPYTINLHVKEFMIERLPHKMGFTVTGAPLGSGMLNLPKLLDAVAAFGRCESAILEQWVVPEADLALTIKKEEAWAVSGIQYLKQLIN